MNKSLQICQGLCYEEIFEHLKSDQENHCKKSCNILEFKARYEADGIYMKFRDRDFLDELLNFRYKMWKKWRNECWAWKGNYTPENAIFMEFRFEPPEQSRALRSIEPIKMVHQEYRIMPTVSFVGNVGGTFGMFIGFSFLGTSESHLRTRVRIMKSRVRTAAMPFLLSVYVLCLSKLLC